ncbi:MAG: zinc ribbon domain-containing protein [SAR202 cluster bacterium]|nr:zinc ribbon domain-containing protein [SAR202 cluster bacterium]
MKICFGIIIGSQVGFILDVIIFSGSDSWDASIPPVPFAVLIGPITGGILAAVYGAKSKKQSQNKPNVLKSAEPITCANCGGINKSFAKYCAYCDQKLIDNVSVKCAHCQSDIRITANFCVTCGSKIN